MTQPIDPKRWKDGAGDAPPQFRECLAADEARGPDPDTLARMLKGVASDLGRPELQAAFESRLALQPSVASAGAATWKLGTGLVALAIGAAAYWTLHSAPENPRLQPNAAVAPAFASSADQANAADQVVPPAPPVGSPAPPVGSPAPALAPASVPLATAPALAPSSSVSASPRTRRTTEMRPAEPAAELALLERAQHALATDARAALVLAEQHRRDHAHGTFEQEREVLAIDALLRLGERAAAERRAQAFLRAFPSSSHRPHLQDLLRSAR